MKGLTVTTAASTALFNAIIRNHDDGRTPANFCILSEVRALLASGSRLTNAEIASIKGKITNIEETASEEMAGGDHGWAWENVAKAKTMQEGLDLHSAAAASDYKINQSKSTSLGEWKKEVEKNKQKLNDGSSESKPQSKEASKCGPAPAPGKSSPLESNTTAQANLEQKILAAKNAYREAEDIDPTSSDNDALKSIWIALLADLKELQSNELVYNQITATFGLPVAEGETKETADGVNVFAPGETMKVLNHSKRVGSVDYSSDGRFVVSGSNDNTVRIWDVESGDCIKTLEGHTSYVYGVSFSPNNQYEGIKLW